VAWTKAPEEERRRQIVDAASQVAAREGLARLTLRGVAAEAGLSHGLVLFHFGSKEALLDALLDATLDWLVSRGPGGEDGGFWDRLRAEAAGADRRRTAVLLDFWVLGSRDDRLRARLRDAVTRYEEALSDLVATAEDAPTGPAVPSPGRLATATVFGTALRSLLDVD
jgi:AcrR family transcriptional regulator